MTASHLNVAEPAIVRSEKYRLKPRGNGYTVLVNPGTDMEGEVFASDGGLMDLQEAERVMDYLENRSK